MLRIIFRAMLFSLTLIALFTTGSFAQSVTVVKDNGDGAQYRTLPKNYIQITNMDLSNAQIVSGSGYSITSGYTDEANYSDGILIWTGKPPAGFGSSNVTNDANANLKRNRLPDVTLRFPNGARSSDGTYYDILLAISEVDYYLGKSRSDKIGDNTTLIFQLGCDWGTTCIPPRKALSAHASASNNVSAGCTVASRQKHMVKVVKHGTNEAIGADCPTMLVVFKDLDILDRTIKKSASASEKGNGAFAEGIEMVSGWSGNAVICRDGGDPANTRLVGVQTINGNTKIKVDGERIKAFYDITGRTNDIHSLWSGFVCGVQPQGFSYYWTGSLGGGPDSETRMGSMIGGQPTVAVKAKRSGPGANVSSLGGNGAGSGVESWHTNTHLMNSDATYTATPGKGVFLKSLKVDDALQSISEPEKDKGKSYYFSKLNKYPLPSRDPRTGQPLEASASSFYTIEAEFGRYPKYEAKKAVSEASIAIRSEEKLHFQLTCDEIYPDACAGQHLLNDDLAGGILSVDPDSVTLRVIDPANGMTTDKAEASYDLTDHGIDMVFETADSPGIKPRLLLTYDASVDWEKYSASQSNEISNLLYGKNDDKVGGDVTGNPVSVSVTSNLKLSKKVAGKLRDTTKDFEFEVSLKGLSPDETYLFQSEGGSSLKQVVTGKYAGSGFKSTNDGEAVIICKAKGGQGFTLMGLPIGAKYQVTEAASDHIASYKLLFTGDRPEPVRIADANVLGKRELATQVETLDKDDGTVTVEFTNRRDPVPVSGMLIHYKWPLAMILVMIALTVFLLLRKQGRKW